MSKRPRPHGSLQFAEIIYRHMSKAEDRMINMMAQAEDDMRIIHEGCQDILNLMNMPFQFCHFQVGYVQQLSRRESVPLEQIEEAKEEDISSAEDSQAQPEEKKEKEKKPKTRTIEIKWYQTSVICQFSQEECNRKGCEYFKEMVKPPEFGYMKQHFETLLNGLADPHGNAYKLVLDKEQERQTIQAQAIMMGAKPTPQNTPVIVNPSTTTTVPIINKQSAWSNMFGLTPVLMEMVRKKQEANEPQVASEKEILDALQLGKQLLALMNKLWTWLKQCYARELVMPSEMRWEYYHLTLQAFIRKITEITRTFARTNTEYKKETIVERLAMMFEAMSKMAQSTLMAQSFGIQPLNPNNPYLGNWEEEG